IIFLISKVGYRLYFYKLYYLIILIPKTRSDFEFTNIKCTSMNESYCSFDYCVLKSVNRTYKYASLKAIIHQGPAYKIKVNFALYKRLNGYKPFLYNVTVDGCKFIKKTNSSPVAAFIYNLFGPFSNINHTCPYDKEILVERAPISHINEQLTKILPFPPGEYGFFSTWYSYGIQRAIVNVYGTLS
ncbi:hypothetical protein KR032_004489, partial [Drosophila birchii]